MDNYLNKQGLDQLLEDISKSIINHTSSSIEDNTTEPNNFPTVRAVIDYCKSNIFQQANVFGGIINEEITPIQESTDRNDYMQVFFCKPLNSFYYRIEEFGTTKYYANWNTKENYMDKWGYPYVGKLYFNVSNEKYYYYSFTGLKELVMDTITYFENLLDDSDTDIEISYQSASDESIGVVIWSKKFNRFVFSTDEEGDAVYYDNWSTRDHYMVGQSAKLMHFYLNGTDGKLYFTDPEGILIKVTDDFLKAESNQVSKFIPITDINNAFDVNTVFNGNPLLVKDFHWKYYVTANRRVVGILEVTVGQNNSGIEITERFTTSCALSNNAFRPAGEGHNIYTRHCYSYRDDSREIRPGVWTTWYKYSERFTTSEKTKLTELPTNNELKSTLDRKVEEVTLEKTSDLTYTLKVDGQAAGVINIPKDQFLKSADYDSASHKITLVFETTDGEKTTEIDLTDLIDVYTAGNGLQKSNNEFSIKIDPATESYLTVTPAGLKVSGINDALATKADKNSVYTKTETDTKLSNKADKNSVYTKTETDTKLSNKADKASTLEGYGIGDAYTKRNVDALLANKAGTDVYRQIADVDADRRAAPFGKIISEQIDTEEESYGGDILEDQICYSTVLSTFVYKEFGTTKYYANWPTKKHYIGADGYPYLGKQFYCHDEDKMYVFDGAKLKAVQIPAVVSFFDVVGDDIDIIMGSVAEEDEFPEYEVVFSTVHNRFVYKADDGKFYDNWSTRYLYIDQTIDNNNPRTDVLYFALDASKLYMYDYEMSNELMPVNEDLTGFLKKNDHALTEFITAGREATVVDYASIFENNLGEISKMHWMYFIHIQQKVVGIMDVQVSYAGNASRIRITERLRTRTLLSKDKKSILWEPSFEWKEDHEYTRFILSYNDMSQEIKAGEWTAWVEVPKLTIAEKRKIGNVYTKQEVDGIAGDKESKMAIIETGISSTIQAEVGKCYTFSQRVDTLAISLPAPTENTHISNIMMYFKTGATPAVTITSRETLLYQDGYEIDANTRYELNCLFNGKEWVVAAMKIGEK